MLRVAILAFGLLAALPAALTPVLAEEINQSFFGTAIEGYDPVAYFTQGMPVEGSDAYTHDWRGATWKFSSQENLELFKSDPEAYAPQYGGYCAYAVAKGSTASIDPEAWAIVDGKLYLNYSQSVQQTWQADRDTYLQQSEANWPSILEDLRN